MDSKNSTTQDRARTIAAIVVSSATVIVSQLKGQPWWLTVSVISSLTVLASVYMVTSAWGEHSTTDTPPEKDDTP
jgi:hypothetical protein